MTMIAITYSYGAILIIIVPRDLLSIPPPSGLIDMLDIKRSGHNLTPRISN